MKWYDVPHYAVLDIETSVHNKGDDAIGSMEASPYHPDNKIVLAGTAIFTGKVSTLNWHISKDSLPSTLIDFLYTPAIKGEVKILVGHNIKFDILYAQRYRSDFIENLYRNNIYLWDTMVVEYILTGQQTKFSSLDDLSIKYGGVLKNDKIKKYWEDGVDTEDIPARELEDYLSIDINNTWRIFLKQKASLPEFNFPIDQIILEEMDALRDSILTEWNGMYVDIDTLKTLAHECSNELGNVEKYLNTTSPGLNWSSPKQLARFLYGGTVSVGKKEVQVFDLAGEPVRYKTGKKAGEIRTKFIDDIKSFKGILTSANDVFGKACFGEGTDEETLKNYFDLINKEGYNYTDDPYLAAGTIDLILKYRKYYKDFHTYYMGIGKAIWGTDSCIHAQFNHTGTDTGRLSSSSPNLQNITGGD